MSAIKLGLLEFGYRVSKYSSVGKLVDIVNYAEMADRLGFSRLWLSEHHNFYALSAWSNPQFLIPTLLSSTDRMKIGMAGILINYYSPYEIAMNYKLMANLYPDRVDLGFANGTPPMNIASMLVQRQLEKYPDDYYQKIADLSEMLHKEDVFNQREKVIIPPFKGMAPDMFALSAGFKKFDFCIEHRLNYAHSLFHTRNSLNVISKENIEAYREQFQQAHGYQPKFILALMGTCAKTTKKAVAQSVKFKESIYGFTFLYNSLIGTPEYYFEKLSEYQEKFGVDEFVIYDCCVDAKQKEDTLHLLSEKFNLSTFNQTRHI